jgi:hypothetical protein
LLTHRSLDAFREPNAPDSVENAHPKRQQLFTMTQENGPLTRL